MGCINVCLDIKGGGGGDCGVKPVLGICLEATR